MAKKGETDEKVQAGTGPETLSKNVPGEPGQREAAALVAGGDPPAADGEGNAPQPREPAEQAGESAGVVSDGTQTALDDEGEGLAADGSASAAGKADGNGNDHSPATEDDQPADNAGAVRGMEGIPEVSDGAEFTNGDGNQAEKFDGAHGQNGEMPSASGSGDNVQGHDAEDSADGVSNSGDAGGTVSAGGDLRNGDDAGRLNGGELDDGPVDVDDIPLQIAAEAYHGVIIAANFLLDRVHGESVVPTKREMPFSMFADLALFIRKIGHRATPQVLGQQLRILKYRESPNLSKSETIAVSAFAHVLMEFDEFARSEAEKIAAAANMPPQPAPLPVEETTMEPVDDPFDTWG